MANNYYQATVQPNFPVSAVTEFEKELLYEYGFFHEIWQSTQGNAVYFFVEDNTRIRHIDVEQKKCSNSAAITRPSRSCSAMPILLIISSGAFRDNSVTPK